MLTRDDPRLLDLAHAIANGLPVAWDELEASATDPSDRTLIRQFQVLARLSALHAAQPSVERTPPPAPARSPMDPHSRSGDARTRADGTARWGPFDLREQIGAGGFGVVYRAWYPELQKHVALKLLHREISRTADQESALIDEARRLARVRHPNVIVVFGADRHDGIVGFWMELVKGVTLAQLLLDRGPFGPREAALVGIDICQALAAVHHAGLVHGDLKARNVMREQGGRHLLMDFGAATELRRLLLQTSPRTVGTPVYMAPEVLAGSAPMPSSDIYSLGVLLYHLVTGEYPVPGRSIDEVRSAHARGERRLLRDARPDMQSAYLKTIERALASDPAERFESAGAMEAALDAALGIAHTMTPASASSADTAASIAVSGASPHTRAIRHRRVTLALGVGLALVSVLFVARQVKERLGQPATPDPAYGIRTLAVLPFDNLAAPDQRYFCDGVTDLLTAALSELTSLRVISRTSATQVRRAQKSLPDIARELHADAVVEGAVYRDGDRVRVTAKLVYASTDTLLWGDTFEGEIRNLFQLQNEVARRIAKRIRLTMTPREEHRLAGSQAINADAQEQYLKGWAALEQMTAEGTREAVTRFESAVRLAPTYARAYAVLSHAYWYLGAGLNILSRDESYSRSREAALHALQLDGDLPLARVALAQIKFYYEWDWEHAEEEFRRAVDLNPSDPDAHGQYGWFLAARGRVVEALDEMKRARELDPLSPTRRPPVAAVLIYARRFDEATRELQAALRLNPNYAVVHSGLARAYAAQRMFREAIEELHWPAFAGEVAVQLELARVEAEAGDRPAAIRIVQRLTSAARDGGPRVPPEALASVYVALGDAARAFDLLDAALAERSLGLVWLKVDPRFDDLRADPRFAVTLRRIGLAQ